MPGAAAPGKLPGKLFPPKLGYIRVRAVAWECGEGDTHTQTAVGNIHFASATRHAK